MSTGTKQATSTEGQIREVVNKWLDAVRTKDADKLLSLYSPDAVLFDPQNALAAKGTVALRKRIEEWFGMFDGPIKAEQRDLQITAGDDMAICHMFGRMNGTGKDGIQKDNWVRATCGLKRSNGKWLLIHEHASIPVDMTTGKANFVFSP